MNTNELDQLIERQSELTIDIEATDISIKANTQAIKKIKRKSKIKKVGTIVIIPATAILLSCLIGHNPFKKNKQKVDVIEHITTDVEGNIHNEEDVYRSHFDGIPQSKVYYYTAWSLTDNNNYSREVYGFDIANNKEKIIDELGKISNLGEEITIERITEIIKPYCCYYRNGELSYSLNIETTSTVTSEEYSKKGSVTSDLYMKTGNTTYISESSIRHGVWVALLGIVTGIAYILEYSYLWDVKASKEKNDGDSLEELDDIIEQMLDDYTEDSLPYRLKKLDIDNDNLMKLKKELLSVSSKISTYSSLLPYMQLGIETNPSDKEDNNGKSLTLQM